MEYYKRHIKPVRLVYIIQQIYFKDKWERWLVGFPTQGYEKMTVINSKNDQENIRNQEIVWMLVENKDSEKKSPLPRRHGKIFRALM